MKKKILQSFKVINPYGVLFTLLLVSLPFSLRVTNITVVITFAYWLFIDRSKVVRDYTTLIFLIILFLSYMIGTTYSQNLSEALFDLEKHLPLLLFPIIFSTIIVTERQRTYLCITFLTTVIIAMLYCLGWEAFAHYKVYGRLYPANFDYFRLSELTQITQLEPPYFGMYIGLALLILSNLFKRRMISIHVFLSLSLFSGIFLLFSGARTATIASIIALFVFWTVQKRFKIVLILTLTMVVIAIIVFYDSVLRGRFKEAVTLRNPNEAKTYSSLSLRLDKWNSAFSVIKRNLFFGVGTGDHQAALNKSYLENNVYEAYDKKYNAHNQYLEITVALGLVGLFCLLSTLAVGLYHSFARKDWIYFSFILLFSVCILTESMLERQKGVVFFSFFNSFLAFSSKKDDDESLNFNVFLLWKKS